MHTNKIIFGVVVLCVAAAAGLFSYAYWKGQAYKENSLYARTASDSAANTTIEDGTYVATIRSSAMSSGGTVLTFSHVTYFEGDEASSTAAVEGNCGDTPLEVCAPTLSRGFYVRESQAPDFSASIPTDAHIVLQDNASATIKELETIERVSEPVFEVTIKGGVVTEVREKSPL